MLSAWASYQIRKVAGCACTGNAGNVFPPPRVSDPDMHHDTCVTHVPWCMPGSLTSCFLWSRWRENRSRHSMRMHNSQFCVSGKRPINPTINLSNISSGDMARATIMYLCIPTLPEDRLCISLSAIALYSLACSKRDILNHDNHKKYQKLCYSVHINFNFWLNWWISNLFMISKALLEHYFTLLLCYWSISYTQAEFNHLLLSILCSVHGLHTCHNFNCCSYAGVR